MHSPSTEGSCSTDLRPASLNSSSASTASIYQAPAGGPAPRFSWASIEEAQSRGSWSALSSCTPPCHLHVAARGWGAQGCRGSQRRPQCRAQVTPSEGSPLCSRSPPPPPRLITFSYPEHSNPPATPSHQGPGSRAPSWCTSKAPVATLIVLMLVAPRALGLEGRGAGESWEERQREGQELRVESTKSPRRRKVGVRRVSRQP